MTKGWVLRAGTFVPDDQEKAAPVEKTVKVDPSATQLSNGAKALDNCSCLSQALMVKLSAKEKRIIAEAVYRAMVGNPQNQTEAQ